MPDNLHEKDILGWAQEQIARLRRLAAGEQVEGLDFATLIDEVEAVGRMALHAVESVLQQILIHLLKIAAWPSSPAVGCWRIQVGGFLAQVQREWQPSMAQKVSIPCLYRASRRAVMGGSHEGVPAGDLPERCPVTIDDLLAEDASAGALVERFTRGSRGHDVPG